jgi:hypothetical protein
MSDYDDKLNNVTRKIRASVTCSCLLALEEDLNKIGLTIQTTVKNRMIMCKIVNNRPFCESIIDDYIFIGVADQTERELGNRAIDCIVDFVENASRDEETEILDKQREWQKQTSLYGKISVFNEDAHAYSQDFI